MTQVDAGLLARADHAIKALRGTDYKAVITSYSVAQSLAEIIEQLVALRLTPSPSAEPVATDPLEKLVADFSKALLAKLKLARANGRDGWDRNDWEKQCQQGLLRHVAKGDPRDVAAYCAFMWHHGWITASPSAVAWGRVIDGKAVTISRERTPANDEPLYASPPVSEASREALDTETIQILLDLLNPLHGELDRQTYDAKDAMDFDMPSDYAHDDISITAQMECDLNQAVLILERRKRDAQSFDSTGDADAHWRKRHLEYPNALDAPHAPIDTDNTGARES